MSIYQRSRRFYTGETDGKFWTGLLRVQAEGRNLCRLGTASFSETNRDWDGCRQRLAAAPSKVCAQPMGELHRFLWLEIYVQNGLVTQETQQTDYPRTPS
ncbi:hypothetical protein KCP78_07815 [Salmonella enterica subsp. enterica]|nr:hypothetical protein KCP78_07815 [Salmonella enterica subsp. enterica]